MSLFPPDLYTLFPSFSGLVRVASPSVALRAPPPPASPVEATPLCCLHQCFALGEVARAYFTRVTEGEAAGRDVAVPLLINRDPRHEAEDDLVEKAF